jgi:hypothetical protein
MKESVETYAVKDGDNPIAAMIEAWMKNARRKQIILDSGDPAAAVELMKKRIRVRKLGDTGWQYAAFIPKFNTHFKILSSSRLAEDMRYNPFR